MKNLVALVALLLLFCSCRHTKFVLNKPKPVKPFIELTDGKVVHPSKVKRRWALFSFKGNVLGDKKKYLGENVESFSTGKSFFGTVYNKRFFGLIHENNFAKKISEGYINIYKGDKKKYVTNVDGHRSNSYHQQYFIQLNQNKDIFKINTNQDIIPQSATEDILQVNKKNDILKLNYKNLYPMVASNTRCLHILHSYKVNKTISKTILYTGVATLLTALIFTKIDLSLPENAGNPSGNFSSNSRTGSNGYYPHAPIILFSALLTFPLAYTGTIWSLRNDRKLKKVINYANNGFADPVKKKKKKK